MQIQYFTYYFLFFVSACKDPDVPSKVIDDKELITSPLYPESYPTNQKCTWLVSAPNNTAVGFKLTDCILDTGDYVEIRDGNNETDAVLHFNNSNIPRLHHWWTSSGPFLWIRFRSYFINGHHILIRRFKMQIQFVKTPEGKLVSELSGLV